jgi:uncharacterized damage-inducible protein DinB
MTDAKSGEVQHILDQLRRVFDGDAWYGPSIREVLAGVAATQAAARPIPSAHTIWELVLHMTAWKREVLRRLRGGEPGLPMDGDWPSAPPATESAWAEAQAALASAHEELWRTLHSFPGGRLHEIVGQARDRPLGTGVTYYATLHGLVQHDAYHTGQIALLKKA